MLEAISVRIVRPLLLKKQVVQRYHAYCDELNLALPGYKLPGELKIYFFIEMPKSWSKNKRLEMIDKPHAQKPDIDNLCKAFMDAWHSDDSHVYALSARKFWSDNPRIVIDQ